MTTLILNLSRATPPAGAGEVVWGPREIIANLRGLRALAQAFRYAHVRVLVDELDGLLSPKPLLAARAMARQSAALIDTQGRSRHVRWRDLPGVISRAAAGALAWNETSRDIEEDLAALERAPPVRADGGAGALVVRPDIWFGLRAGGALAHTAGILNAFVHEGCDVRVLTHERLPLDGRVTQRIVARTDAPTRAERALLAFNRDLINAAAAEPAPAFVYQRHGLYGYAGALIARRLRAPFVLEHNGSEVWIGDHWGSPVAARAVADRIERRMVACADLITVVSAPLIEHVVALGAPRSRVLLVPNAADTERYRPDIDAAAVRARYALGEAPVIGFIGTFGRWHGAPVLAHAFAALRRRGVDARLLMVGDGPERAEAEQILAHAGVRADAVFTGLVAQAEGPRHLAAADILVSPTLAPPDGSDFFGSPTKLYEYMAMGRAIIASDLAQLSEVLTHERTALLTPPADAAALTDALRRLCKDAALRARLGAAARDEAVARHQWRHRAAIILDAVQTLRAAVGR